jgi:RimJ/RimL family protein N-acetyltransferase
MEVALRDGRTATIRPLRPEDKEDVVNFYAHLSTEVLRWALPPYDRARVERFFANPEQLIGVVAVAGNKIVGHLHIFRYASRMSHVGDLIIYLRQDFSGIGLGTEMMRYALVLAKEKGLHRLQLSVIMGNDRAIHVYEKVGFRREGVRPDAYKGEDGRYHDALEMGTIL